MLFSPVVSGCFLTKIKWRRERRKKAASYFHLMKNGGIFYCMFSSSCMEYFILFHFFSFAVQFWCIGDKFCFWVAKYWWRWWLHWLRCRRLILSFQENFQWLNTFTKCFSRNAHVFWKAEKQGKHRCDGERREEAKKNSKIYAVNAIWMWLCLNLMMMVWGVFRLFYSIHIYTHTSTKNGKRRMWIHCTWCFLCDKNRFHI